MGWGGAGGQTGEGWGGGRLWRTGVPSSKPRRDHHQPPVNRQPPTTNGPTTCRYESTLFLFLEHPYDVGDNVLLAGELYTIKRIHLMYTEMVGWCVAVG